MSIKSGRSVVWGHLILLTVIVGVVVAYLFDARGVSLRTNNLLLVQPAAILALVLAAFVLPGIFPRAEASEQSETSGETWGDLLRVFILIAALAGLAFLLEVVGFDIATFAFMVIGLAVCGERRWWVNLLFSALFTVFLIYGYGTITPFPFPLTIL
jgi:Tripartite tricarboxylate transporter TctB family